MSSPALAADRSMRRIDADGHMHVEQTNISKANVCPYYGREIPNGAELGLDPNRVYMLYRDPAELKAAAYTFAGKPLLMHHIPVTADEPSRELWVGTIGTTVEFVAPYLKAPLSVWTREAIDAIEADPKDPASQRELSPGYRYTADMTPGHTPEGIAFHGRMRNIMGNHVAIVAEGRTGPDVYVADEVPPEFSTMRFPKFLAALAAVFPTLSANQAIALDSALDAELKDKDRDMSEDEKKTALDAYCASTGKAMDALTDEDRSEAYKRAAKDGKSPAASEGTNPPHAALDESVLTTNTALRAVVDKRVADAVTKATDGLMSKDDAGKLAQDAAKTARTEVHALYAARKAVEPVVGVTALDSAEAVYRFALDHLKVAHKDIGALALPALYEQSAKAAAPAPAIAADAATFDPSILGLTHIRKG